MTPSRQIGGSNGTPRAPEPTVERPPGSSARWPSARARSYPSGKYISKPGPAVRPGCSDPAALTRHGSRKPCKHRDLGFVVDLGACRRWPARRTSRCPMPPPRSSPAPATSTPCLPTGCGRYRLVQRHHRISPVRTARPDSERILRSHSSRAHRHLLPGRRTGPSTAAARIKHVNTGDPLSLWAWAWHGRLASGSGRRVRTRGAWAGLSSPV